MAKIKAHWDRDDAGSFLVLEKSRGKLSFDEMADFIRYELRHYGHFIVFLNCGEQTCGGNGLFFEESDPKGDSVRLYEYAGEDNCPACGRMTPPQYCPECGAEIKIES